MTSPLSVRVEIPADLYERMRDVAARSDRSVEDVLVESLALLFGEEPVDWEHLAATLHTLPDEQLWALVYRRMFWPAGARVRELTARGEQMPLTTEEQAELETLIAEADRFTLLRSRALLLLKQHGQDVESYLKLGA